MGKQVKVWTPKMRAEKAKQMKAYWRKRKGAAGSVAPLDRMAKLLKASRVVSAAPQSTVRQLDEKLAEVMGTIAKLRQVLAEL